MTKISWQSRLSSLWWLVALLPILGIFLWNVVESYSYDSDFARDMSDMLSIAQGDIRLLGPKLSFGGIHTGPYYYYVFAPLLVIAADWAEAVILANAILAWIGVVSAVGLLIKSWRFPPILGVLGGYWLSLVPAILFSARGPGNAFTHQIWFVVALLLIPMLLQAKRWWWWLMYGLAVGVLVNFHLIGLVVFVPLLAVLSLDQIRRSWKRGLARMILLGIGVGLAFTPIILFDVTHGFVQFTNTFIDRSYLAFTENTNLPSPMPTSVNPLVNFGLLQTYLSQWLGLPFVVILIVTLGIGILKWHKLSSGGRILLITLPVSTILFVLIARSQLAIHYLFPVALLSATTVLIMVGQAFSSKVALTAISLLLLISFISFPTYSYLPAGRSISDFKQFVSELQASSVGQYLQPNSFLFFVTRETPLAPLGHEYRYLLEANGVQLLPVDQYAQAKYLIWIAERPEIDYLTTQAWELDQFGERKEVLVERIGSREVRVFEKADPNLPE